ncbi:MAG: hypothetical protein IT516_15405 [Burkholderiales bacterium]|nr:hypothetical protein [Burkholderiales bacterium]
MATPPPSESAPDPAARRGARRWFVGFLTLVAVVAGFELASLVRSPRVVPAPSPAPTASAPAPTGSVAASRAGPFGDVDAPAAEAVIGPRIVVSGWALDPVGVRAVEIRIGGQIHRARLGIARPDVARVRTDIPDNANGGYEFTGDFSDLFTTFAAPDRQTLTIVAIAKDGRERVLGTRSLIDPRALGRWAAFTPRGAEPFHLLPALSGLDLGGAAELDTVYAPYLSATLRAGFRVPILYLRTTKGAAQDFVFDPDWDTTRQCGERRIADDSLNGALAHSIAHKLPVLVTLNGGIWADAYCDVPEWDVNDKLEQDLANDQWNEKNEVMPDDYLKSLPGSLDAPQLARSLTFNVHATAVRHYKKRNLQQAAVLLARFAREHPDLFVGINLDPDTYLNPFFAEAQWYDYNPGTLRQFREWLAGTGPYAGRGAAGVPNLTAYRRSQPLSLAQVNALAGRQWRSWQEVDPPRAFSRDPARPFWQDAWVREWEHFRRHLVHLHYDELAGWLVEAGISRDRIWSSQGLMAPRGDAMPFAIDLGSPPRNYDSGGMTLAGSKPASGHLGVILYGEAAANGVAMDNGRSLFATLATVDPRWAIVEYNTADLRDPAVPPTYAAAYRGLRDMWNFGARYMSPMAWNGSNGAFVGQPGYSTFMAWRNTPLESAARDFMLARAGLPLGALLWTFGTPSHADGDGWVAEQGRIALAKGGLVVTPDANGRAILLSPADLPASLQRATQFVIGVDSHAGLRRVRVQGRLAGGGWRTLVDATGGELRETPAGIAVTHGSAERALPLDQLRLELTFRSTTPRTIARVAVLPAR